MGRAPKPDRRDELRRGAAQGPWDVTVYLCQRNHQVVVWGPHAFLQVRDGWYVVKATWWTSGDSMVVRDEEHGVCRCGAQVKKRHDGAVDRRMLPAAVSALLVGDRSGLKLAGVDGDLPSNRRPQDYKRHLPDDFPASRTWDPGSEVSVLRWGEVDEVERARRDEERLREVDGA